MVPVCVTAPFQDCGLFGARRKFDIHTGLDLYCEDEAEIRVIEAGVVVDVFTFTGEEVGTPWWNTTQAVVVESGDMTYVYGEVKSLVSIGDTVKAGDIIGSVTPVLKVDKGTTSVSMLHLEVWLTEWYIKNFTWKLGEDCPNGLCDPILFIDDVSYSGLWLIKTESGYILEDNSGSYLQFFTMAADSKSFLLDTQYKYLRESSPLEDKLEYTICTGKTLWFDNKERTIGQN